MSIRFPGSTGITFTSGAGGTVTGVGTTIIAGWWRTTSIASGDYYWSAGSTNTTLTSLRASATGSANLEVRLDQATTDSIYRSTDASLTTNTWQFIAVAIQSTTGGVADMFVGTETERPRLLSKTTVTAGSGAMSAQANLHICSGLTTGAYLGAYVSQVYNVVSANDYLNATTLDAQYCLDRFIVPMWNGTFDPTSAMIVLGNGLPGLFPSTTYTQHRVRWMPMSATTGIGSTLATPVYVVQRENSATSMSSSTVMTTVEVGTPEFSILEPAAVRRMDNPATQNVVSPLLMRV